MEAWWYGDLINNILNQLLEAAREQIDKAPGPAKSLSKTLGRAELTLFDDGWAEEWLFVVSETHCKSDRTGLPIRPVIRVIVDSWCGPGACRRFPEQDYRTELQEPPWDEASGPVHSAYGLFKYLRAKHNGTGCYREPSGALSFLLVLPDEAPWVEEQQYYEGVNDTFNGMLDEVKGWFEEARKWFARDAEPSKKFHFPLKRSTVTIFDGGFVDALLCIESEASVASERVELPVRPAVRVSVDMAQKPRHTYMHGREDFRQAPERSAIEEPPDNEKGLYGLFKYLREKHGGTGCYREPDGALSFVLVLPDAPHGLRDGTRSEC
jgi:hypothetical protein